MAPTTATYTARVTRSATRKNSTTLVSLDAGVRKRFQCIICDKKHRSRAALSHHFKKSHPTRPQELSPFTHPSCWGESSTLYPISRQHLLDMMGDDDEFDRLSAKKQRAIEAKITYAQAGVRNKKQLRQKEDQQRLCLLHWWFRTNEEALRARMEFGPEGLFPRQGEPKVQDQGQGMYLEGITAEDDSLLELADAPPVSQLEPLSAAPAPTTQADQLVPDPDQVTPSVSAQDGYFDLDFGRSLHGATIADFELASTRPLASLPILWCISNAFTHFVEAHGENLQSVITLELVVRAYLCDIGVSQDSLDRLDSRFDHRIMRKYDNDLGESDEEKWIALLNNAKRFRKDRAFVWDVLEEATNDYFNDYVDGELPVGSDAVEVVVKATRELARMLGDAQTAAYIKRYRRGRI